MMMAAMVCALQGCTELSVQVSKTGPSTLVGPGGWGKEVEGFSGADQTRSRAELSSTHVFGSIRIVPSSRPQDCATSIVNRTVK